MYALPSAVPFRGSPYAGFSMSLQLSQGLPPQQQPHTSTHLYPSRPPRNPYMELPKEMLPQGGPPQGQETEKPRQFSPGRGMLAHATSRPQDFQAKMHTAAQARPHILEQTGKPPENRPVYSVPLEAPGRHSISMSGGDTMRMVDQHFQMSG